jgi:sphingolipid delta-4 desaturase
MARFVTKGLEALAANADKAKFGSELKSIKGIFTGGATIPVEANWHAQRKKAIMKAHPEIAQLQGTDWKTFPLACIYAAVFTVLGIWACQYSWWIQLILAYTVGGYCAFCASVLGHDGVHGLAGGGAINDLTCIIGFLPGFIGAMGQFFKVEHIWHHSVVVDRVVRFGPQHSNFFKKLFVVTLTYAVVVAAFAVLSALMLIQMTVHAILHLLGKRKTLFPTQTRIPAFSRFPHGLHGWMYFNLVLSLVYEGVQLYYFGYGPVLFRLISCVISNGPSPLGMRNVQEHYYQRKGQPTTSVYAGLVNTLTFNIGFHVEHHDFSTIPCMRLPKIREIAPEHYNTLFAYRSYTEVLTRFFTDPGIPLNIIYEGNPLFSES